MEKDQSVDTYAVRARLEAYRDKDKGLEHLEEQIAHIDARLEGLGAVNITDMPRTPSPAHDRMSDLINQKDELIAELKEDVEYLESERRYFNKIFRKMKSDHRSVLRFRYIQGLKWSDVAEAMYGARIDFNDKEESYRHRVLMMHEAALSSMASYISKS